MNFGTRKRSAVPRGVVGTGGVHGGKRLSMQRVCPATLYNDPPNTAISLDDFEGLAVERLRVMANVEKAQSRNVKFEELENKLEDLIRNTHLAITSEENKVLDNISHWVLRLALSSSEALKRRFLAFESLLFKLRFKRMTRAEVTGFINENNLGYHPIADAERDACADDLRVVHLISRLGLDKEGGGNRDIFNTKWYKVSFTEVPSLVGQRKVFVKGGMAYVPQSALVEILSQRFRTQLSKHLAIAVRSLPFVKQDDRIAPIIGKLQLAYLGPDFGRTKFGAVGTVTPETIGQIAEQSFPMCMRELHHALKRDNHLKYFGRVQFRLFLKGIGLSMDDCLAFFQREFAKKCGPEEFQKKYAYNIRHSYGQEGKRANYTPHSCVKIITGNTPGPGEYHGCPFKSYDKASMERALTRRSTISRGDIDRVLQAMEKKDFQIACRIHFEVTHKGADSDKVGEHPNAWYEESAKFWNEQAGKNKSQESQTTVASQASA